MIKIFYSLIGLLVFSGVSNAQELKFGPKVGANFSSFSGIKDSKSKTGVYFGAVAEVKFLGKFSIQPEVLYTVQGAKYSAISIPTGSVDGEINNHYVSVPIIFKYKIIGGLGLEVGPKFDFLAKSENKLGSFTKDTKDAFESFNLGLALGLGCDLPLGFFIDARYNIGLSKIDKDISIAGIPIEAKNIKNDVFQIGVGYKF